MYPTSRQARSYSAALSPLLAQQPPYLLTVLSSHRHACNLCTPAGMLLALITPPYDNGPFHIVVPSPALPRFPINTPAQYHAGILSLPGLQLTLATATAWQPQLPLLQQTSIAASLWLHEVKVLKKSALQTGPTAQVVRVQKGIRALAQGVITGDLEYIRGGVVALAGLGPGLTPAGDDFLVGLLAAIHATAHQDARQMAERQQLARDIALLAASRTTRLSAAWLRHGGEGHFGERWHHLIFALNRQDGQAIATAVTRIVATGATSGADGLFGFITALGWCGGNLF